MSEADAIATRVELPLLTVSGQKAFRACPRLYLLRYEQFWRPKFDADTLRFGTLFHKALEIWWSNQDCGDGSEILGMALEALSGEADPFDRARAEAMIVGYHYRWLNARLEVLHIEAQFRAQHINPETGHRSRTWDEGGKIDAIARTPDGRVWIVEHKTSSEDIAPGSTYWRRLRLDAQISTYMRGAAALGFDDVAGCLYDVIGKPTLRPYKATPIEEREYTKEKSKVCKVCKKKNADPGVHKVEIGRLDIELGDELGEPVYAECNGAGRIITDSGGKLYANQRVADETPGEYRARLLEHIGENPERYYQRGDVVRLDAEKQSAALDMWQTGRSIADAKRLNHWPRNPQSCVSYGRTCDFFDVCTDAASLDDTTRFRRADTQHEELKQ